MLRRPREKTVQLNSKLTAKNGIIRKHSVENVRMGYELHNCLRVEVYETCSSMHDEFLLIRDRLRRSTDKTRLQDRVIVDRVIMGGG